MSNYIDKFNNCLEKSIPYCTAACPFNMDILGFIDKCKKGSVRSAYNTYRNAVGFPRIASYLCPHPCLDICPKKNHGGAILLHELEKASIMLSNNTSATNYNLPKKDARIAIIGAGISGLGALLRLSTKNYDVNVFERTNRVGGYLYDIMPKDVIDTDLSEQLDHLPFKLHLNTNIQSLEDLSPMNYDVVIVATGDNGNDLELFNTIDITIQQHTFFNDTIFLLAGGLLGKTPVHALAHGLRLGSDIDTYLKSQKNLQSTENTTKSLCEGIVTIKDETAQIPPSNSIYTKEEFKAEAARCVECKCSHCYQHCDICQYTNKWPIKLKDEVVATTIEGKSDIKATPARRLISLCNHCGLCKEICPEQIDMDTLFNIGRQKMFQQGKMPWAFHEYYRKDMDHANTEASLLLIPKNDSTGNEYEICSFAFFPGCQLGASEPDLVLKSYEYIRNIHPNTALILQCCGVSAEWEGDLDSFNNVLNTLHEKWASLGKPIMITTCMTCYQKIKKHLPDIPLMSLYSFLANFNAPYDYNRDNYSIFNPCSVRNETHIKDDVYNLINKMNININILEENEQYFKCCGFGGHGNIADKAYTDYIVNKRIAESIYPYITYCINCRDLFKSHNKAAVHILELFFNHISEGPLPTVTDRWHNRLYLKQQCLQNYNNTTYDFNDAMLGITLIINDTIKEKLNTQHIYEHEIAQVIDFCERTNRIVVDTITNTLIGSSPIGHMTYWVEYKVLDRKEKTYEVLNAYGHRIKIEMEAVWNGVKQDDEV